MKLKTLPAGFGPIIDKSAVRLDSTKRSYTVHTDGNTYRVKSTMIETKPRKFQAVFAVDLAKPYTPKL